MKGSSLIDPLYIGIALIIFGIGCLFIYAVMDLIAQTGFLGIYATNMYQFFQALNNVSIFIVLGMSLGTIVSAYLIKESPVFFFVAIIFLFLQILILPGVVSAFNAIAADPTMANAQGALNLLVFLIEELPIITTISSAVAALLGLTRG